MMEGLTEGRIVHYVLEDGPSKGQHRPAIVVQDWKQENGLINLQVFTDGLNDDYTTTYTNRVDDHETAILVPQNATWCTSVHYSEEKEPGTWHWIEKA